MVYFWQLMCSWYIRRIIIARILLEKPKHCGINMNRIDQELFWVELKIMMKLSMNKGDFERWSFLINTKSKKIYQCSYKFIEALNGLRKLDQSDLIGLGDKVCWLFVFGLDFGLTEVIFSNIDSIGTCDALCFFPSIKKWVVSFHEGEIYEIRI